MIDDNDLPDSSRRSWLDDETDEELLALASSGPPTWEVECSGCHTKIDVPTYGGPVEVMQILQESGWSEPGTNWAGVPQDISLLCPDCTGAGKPTAQEITPPFFRAFTARGFTADVYLKTISRRRRRYWCLSYFPGDTADNLPPCWMAEQVHIRRGRKLWLDAASSDWVGSTPQEALNNVSFQQNQ